MATSFNRVQLSTGGTAYFLVNYKVEDSDEFLLSVFDGNKVWKGKFDDSDIENMRKNLLDHESLLKKTKDALTCEYSSDMSYEYKLDTRRAEFQWHYAPDEDISYMLGSCTLKPARDPFKSMCEILDHCVDRNKEMKERLSAVQTDYDRISQERANALKRLEKCVVAKEELEEELCSKCVDILNSKKEKIRTLKSYYANGDSLAERSHVKEKPVKTGIKRRKKRSAPSDEENEQEKSGANTADKKKRLRRSKRALKKSLQKDDLVVLDTSDCIVETSLVSRQRRNAETTNKQKIPSESFFSKVPSSRQKQRNAYDSNFKLGVVSFAETHTNAETMRYFGINEKLVRDWKKSKTKLEALERPVKKMRFNTSPVEALEKELIVWVTDLIDQGYVVKRRAIRLKALEFAKNNKTLAPQDFKASAGWCTKFMNRHGLYLQKASTESEQWTGTKEEHTASSTTSNSSQDNIDHDDLIDNFLCP